MEENRKVSTCRCWKLGRHYTCLWAASRGYSSINTCSIKCIWLSVPRDSWQMTNMRQSLMKSTCYTSHTCVSHETIIRDTTRSTRCSSFIISFLIFMCAYDGFVCVCVSALHMCQSNYFVWRSEANLGYPFLPSIVFEHDAEFSRLAGLLSLPPILPHEHWDSCSFM